MSFGIPSPSAYFHDRMEQVILVNTKDQPVGVMEKMEAHRQGALHRAFSVVIFNSKGEVLLQKRAQAKYHSGGLWTNACCSHPNPGEDMIAAVQRKLKHEMGLTVLPLFIFKFTYHADVGNGLTEHELDHVYTATCDETPQINRQEVEDWKFMDTVSLFEDVVNQPEIYTTWFRLILKHPDFVAAGSSA